MLISCGPTIGYTGKNYMPTSHVDTFFSAADVHKNYEIMGKVDGKAWLLTSYDKIRKSIVKEARKKGADAVIFTGISEEFKSTTKNNTADTSSSPQIQTVIQAEFIKYK